jgi:hypothetical protein
MSVFFLPKDQVVQKLDDLPESLTNDDILSMVQSLQRDLQSYHGSPDYGAKITHFSEKHQKLLLSFPTLFRCVVKGTFTTPMLKTFLATRTRLEKGEVGKEQAQNILVDAGVEAIKARPRA